MIRPSFAVLGPNDVAWFHNFTLNWLQMCELGLCTLFVLNVHHFANLTEGLCLVFSFRLRKRLSMSESSHTESDSSPPLTVRRRCSGLLDMPRFAISTEDEGTLLKRPQSEGMLLSTVQSREGLPVPIPEQPVEQELQLEGDAGPTTPSTAVSSTSALAGMCSAS